jgi:hypothetical protein
MPSKLIDTARFVPNWTSFVGALEGALRAIGDTSYTTDYLMGITGFAFRMQVHETLCPSGPFTFDWPEEFYHALDLLGYDHEYIQSYRGDNLFDRRQQYAHQRILQSIDADVPAIVLDLREKEFGIIVGYDEEKHVYHISTHQNETEPVPLPFDQLGTESPGILSVLLLKGKMHINQQEAELRSLRRAIDYAHHNLPVAPPYRTGLSAYDYWIKSLKGTETNPMGNAYNAAVYAHTRQAAAQYLREISSHHGDKKAIIEEAADFYQKANENLKLYSEMFPYPEGGPVNDEDMRLQGIGFLKGAKKYEHKGCQTLDVFIS